MFHKLYLIVAVLLTIMFFSCSMDSDEQKQSVAEKITHIKKPVSKEDESTFDSLSKTYLLKRLFDNPWFDSTDVALWKPNYYERMGPLPVSYDGMCHTAVDTIMYFTDRDKRRCAAVILATYNYQQSDLHKGKPEIDDCHFCGVPVGIALLAQHKNGKWHLYRFEKSFVTLGYFGKFRTGGQDSACISLKKIGDSWTCLSLVQGPGGNGGYAEGSEMLYSIEENRLDGLPALTLSNILTYCTYSCNQEAAGGSADSLRAGDITTMRIIEQKGNYYNIDLVTTGSDKKTSVAHYAYSDDAHTYLPK